MSEYIHRNASVSKTDLLTAEVKALEKQLDFSTKYAQNLERDVFRLSEKVHRLQSWRTRFLGTILGSFTGIGFYVLFSNLLWG